MEEVINKHYIKLNEKSHIIKGFSTIFEQPLNDDICINEDGGRHFEMLGIINPPLLREDGLPKYKYINGEILLTTDVDLSEEIAAMQPPEPNLSYDERLTQIELIILQDNGVTE